MERLNEGVTIGNNALLQTSAHEWGHAVIAHALGGDVSVISVVPEGNRLGYTRVVFWNGPIDRRINAMMVSLCGGWVAEEKVGIQDHRGCGMDMAMLDYYASIASIDIYGGRVSPGKIKSNVFSQARSLICSQTQLLNRARYLCDHLVLA